MSGAVVPSSSSSSPAATPAANASASVGLSSTRRFHTARWTWALSSMRPLGLSPCAHRCSYPMPRHGQPLQSVSSTHGSTTACSWQMLSISCPCRSLRGLWRSGKAHCCVASCRARRQTSLAAASSYAVGLCTVWVPQKTGRKRARGCRSWASRPPPPKPSSARSRAAAAAPSLCVASLQAVSRWQRQNWIAPSGTPSSPWALTTGGSSMLRSWSRSLAAEVAAPQSAPSRPWCRG
mmetsp:Transcript_76710/g.197584  ORF Transcript_76710/g.197584 Transcript_76710/m.197584 type:complete len:236 (-) Transcript_76710:259-966(-)